MSIAANALIDAQIAAYVAGDAAAFAAFYAKDAVCVRLPEGKVIASGRREIETVWGNLFDRRDGAVRFELVNRLELGAYVADHERVSRSTDGTLVEAFAIYEVRDGLIARVWLIEPAPPPA